METTVLCLANSKKEGERCIAGIDVRTGEWVRPVSRHTPKGEVPFRERQIEGEEPRVLDLIRMDLDDGGPTGFDYCHAKENRWINPAPWTWMGVADPGDLRRYLCRADQILHTAAKYIRPDLLESKPLNERTTLEIREVNQISFDHVAGKWKATLTTADGALLQDISVTDCLLTERLNAGEAIKQRGYAVISLSVPWIPPIPDWPEGAVGWKLLAGWISAEEQPWGRAPDVDDLGTRPLALSEQLSTGYFLQAASEGGRWRLYDIREKGECRICKIDSVANNLEIQVLTGPCDAVLEHWNHGVQEGLICTDRIIELLWQQEAPQAVADELAAWHREDEAREFAALMRRKFSYASKRDICRCTGKTDTEVQEAMNRLNCREPFSLIYADRLAGLLTGDPSIKRAYDRTMLLEENSIRTEDRPSDGLAEFDAEEAEMARQLDDEGDYEPFWLGDWEAPDEPPDPEEENLIQEEERWFAENLARWKAADPGSPQVIHQVDDGFHEQDDDGCDYPDEIEPESPGYREWDDMDNFWNQEGVFEEMSDLYPLDEDY